MSEITRATDVRRRIAKQVVFLNREDEEAALVWIEAVSEFDATECEDSHCSPRPNN
jgi:hypothetical protein